MSGKRPRLEKVERESLAIVPEQVEKLKELFPEAVSEGKVDFDKLRQTLGDEVDAGPERYSFSWAGKRDCIKLLQVPSRATLVPSPDESIDWDTTNNVFIEGENLEVLKLLYKAYYGRVKMIYIDPPYNTGRDKIYEDNYTDPLEPYLRMTGQRDSEGNVLTSNPETSGRYHSAWLRMMYPRLFVSRQLLTPDGLVFVSIDDKEVHNLRKVMDEIFGEENFVAQFVWNTEGHTDNQFDVKVNHEYVVLYAREWTNAALEPVVDPSTREESNLWKGFAENSITKNGPGNPPSEVTLPVGFPCAVDALRLAPTSVDSSFYSKVGEQGYISRSITREFGVSYPIRIDPMVVESGKLAQQCRVFSGWANADKLRAFIGGQCEPLQGEQGDATRFYLSGGGVIYYRKDRAKARYILSVLRNMGTVEKARSELEQMGVFFDYPKPKELLKYLISIGLGEQGTLVDFFAGSATSAHATLDLNRNSGGRRFVMVQLQEPTNEDSMARKAGFGTIADVGRERVRWVVAEMKKEAEGKLQTDPPQDLGFRVYKLAESNMKPWKGTDEKDPEKYAKTMEMFLDPLVEGWKPENVIAEVALKTDGFGLNCRVERIGHEGTKDTKEKNGSPVIFKVTDEDKEQSFYICLDDKVRLEDVKFLNLTRDMLFVCRDVALDDETAANLALQCRLRTI